MLKRTAIIILCLSLILKLSGFLREGLLAKLFGANHATDGFLLAYTFLTLLMLIVSTGFNKVFLPLYTKTSKTKPDGTARSANALLNISIIFFALLGLLSYLLLPIIAPAVFQFIDPMTRRVAVATGRVFSLFLFVLTLNGMLESYLQAKRSFVPTHLAKLSGTLFSALFGLFFAKRLGIESFAYGFIFGTMVGVVIQIYYLLKSRYAWRFEIKMDDEFRKPFFMLLWPALLSAVVGPVNTFVDKLFASSSVGGAVTFLNNASLIVSIPSVIYTTTIGAIVFTLLSENTGSKPPFYRLLKTGMTLGFLLFVPIAVALGMIGNDAIAFIYQRGAFTKADTIQTYDVLILYTPLIATQGVQVMVSNALYALEQTKHFMKLSVTTVAMNIILNYLFLKGFGFKGLALSSSLVAVYYLFTSVLLLSRVFDHRCFHHLWQSFGRVVLPTMIMALALFGIKQWPGFDHLYSLWRLFIEIVIGTAVYLLATYLFNRTGLKEFLKVLR
ncbi:murein biosynthesis integral membrane protein MurJ [Camelliibacillus cellulosilyticus]